MESKEFAEIEIVQLSKELPTTEETGIFGEVIGICSLREGTEITFRDLSPQDLQRITETGNEKYWFWLKGVRNAMEHLFKT
jgi:hypothetical protein